MATHHGNDGRLKVGSNAVAEFTNWTVNETINTADDSAAGDSWTTHKNGKKSWTASADFHFDASDTTGQGALTNGASVTPHFFPQGEDSGDPDWTGTATVTSINTSNPHNGIVSGTVQLLGNGALDKSGTVA